MIHTFIEDDVISEQLLPALTPNYILTQLQPLPLLTYHLHKNTPEVQHMFIDVLSRVPAKADRPGYIYGFRQKNKYNPRDTKYEIKLGRTSKQVPQYRIMEWQKTDQEEYVQIFTARSEFNFKLQLLVHLLFAYARKTLIIKGKKRIEWFEFGEKVATGAITSQLNLLMEHLHEKYIDKLQHLQIASSEVNYDVLTKNIMKKFITHKQESGFAIFGLPKTGKTLFRSILLEDQLTVIKSEKRLQIVTRDAQKRDNLFIEVSTMHQSVDAISKLQYYFTKCSELCHPQLWPILVVKESDLQSSAMIGVTHALNLLKKYIKLGEGLQLVVSRSSSDYTKSDIMQIIEQNEKLISKQQQAVLRRCEYIVVREAQIQGHLLSKEKSLQVSRKLMNYLQLHSQKFLQVQPTLQQDILHLCYEIIQKSYEVLQQLYAKSFRQKYLQFIEEQDQVEFINNTRALLDQIKLPQKQTLQSMFKQITKITSHLQLNQTAQLQTYLYVFCEMCCYKTMLRSNIFVGLIEAFNEKMASITLSYNQKLDATLQSLRSSIGGCINAGHKQCVALLKPIMQAIDLAATIQIMKQITHNLQHQTKQEVKRLRQCFTGLVQTIEQVVRFSAQGLRFNSVEGRIREAIYYGFKNQ